MQTIIIAGRLGSDAKRNTTQGGDAVANFSIAVETRAGRDKVTNWWRCSLWGKRAEALGPYLIKGTAVSVMGEFSLAEYDGKPQLNCRVAEVTLLGGGDSQRSNTGGARRGDDQRDGRQGSSANNWGGGGNLAEDLSDDIPFITRQSVW